MVDWLKLLHTFPRNPKLRLLARRLKCHKLTAQGLAVQWLIFVDEQTTDGCTHLTVEEMDDELGFRGGAAALCEIGWASLDGEGCMVATEFGKHCGESAKERAEAARRKRSQRERDKCHGKSVTDVTEKAWREKEEENIEETSGQINQRVEQARAGSDAEGFRRWLGAFAMAHPGLSRCRVLPPDVLAAAQEAYKRLPDVADMAGMVGAYMADRMQEDCRRRAFYRPDKGSLYFESLERVLQNAERWARETGWTVRKKPGKASGSAGGAKEAEASEEDTAAFLGMLRNGREDVRDGESGQ